MAATNQAYDLSLFENRAPKKNVPQLRELPAPKKKPKARATHFKALLCSVLCLGLFSAFVYSNVILNERKAEVTSKNTQLEKLNSEQQLMEVELERLFSMQNIDEYATNELGLCKPEQYQITYIKTAGEGKLQVAEAKKGQDLFSIITDFFQNLFH